MPHGWHGDKEATMTRPRTKKRQGTKTKKRQRRIKKRRLNETFQAALEISGGTESNPQPAINSLVEILCSKFPKGAVASAVCDRKLLAEHITSTVHGTSCTEYENSDENMLRSVAVYYGVGVIGKRKYIRKSFYIQSSYRRRWCPIREE